MARTQEKAATNYSVRAERDGLVIERRFTEPGVHPFDKLEWETRDALIGDPAKPAFEQRGVEFPSSWSQNATNIVTQKYFRGQLDTPQRETSVRQIVGRVAGTIANWGREGNYFASDDAADAFEAELTHILVNQMAAFNSPVWFNVGFEKNSQCSACFILSVDDTIESILDWNTKEGMIFRGGSGSGINLSNIRSSREQLSKGGFASGPVSFMRGADAWAGTIKSGGKTRRAAKMVVLDVDHPDIRDFIWCKAREEDKAAALRDAGFDMSIDGEGFHSIQYQNANNSVRVTQEFLNAVERGDDWQTTERVTGDPVDTYDARELMREIAEAAWRCADPGIQYDTTINDWHTCSNTGRINASNPCFPADTQVHTTRGLIPIGDLYDLAQLGVDFKVYTNRATADSPGKGVVATTPVAIMRNGVKPIVRLRFSNGQDVRCTTNHRFWTLNRGYVAAGELTDADEVMLNDSPTPATEASWALPAAVEAKAKSFARGGNVTYQELPDVWSEGLGELTGHLIGDGWLTDVQTGWVYGGDDIDDGLADSHQGMLEQLVGGVSRQQMDNGTVQLRAGSEAVREFFSNLGVTTSRAHDKRVPTAVFGAPTEVQAAFLRGLFGADGCVSWTDTNRYVGLGSRSEGLVKDVQRLLSAFGVRSQIYKMPKDGRTSFSYTRVDGTTVEYGTRDGFDLRVTGSDMERFEQGIGFSTPRKQRTLEALLERFGRYSTKSSAKLIEREDDGQEHVYNLTEPLHHSYMVNGFLVANCSEYMHVDNSACNLSSINLMKFLREDGTFDVSDFEHTVDVMILAQEIVVGPSSYPTEEIGRNARAMRQLGLGYANLGALLMARGLPYDSDDGRDVAAAITALMTGRAYRTSAEMAAAVGPYDEFEKNREPHLNVMRKHRDASYEINGHAVDQPLFDAARSAWDEAVELGEAYGHRNAQATVLAPTGTISFLMDCDTTGIEPDFSLVKYKELVGGGQMTIVNQTVPAALQRLGYAPDQIEQIVAHINERATIVGAPGLKDEHLPVFDVAVGERAISHMGHIKMMAATQPFISGAISKTVNLPAESTVDDIMDAYLEAGRLGVKALAIYRDGSKTAQALKTSGSKEKDAEDDTPRAVRRRLPRERQSITHKFSIAGHEGYITAGMYEDGSLGEIFLTDIGKDGSTLRGMMNAFATGISVGLQYGVPLETYVRKFSYMRFDPEGMTQNPEIPFAKSLPDYIMRWLASRFLDAGIQEELGILTEEVRAKKMAEEGGMAAPAPANGGTNGHANGDANGHSNGESNGHSSGGATAEAKPAAEALTDTPPVMPAKLQGLDLGPACPQCGGMMQRTGSCYTCPQCGNNTGCG